MAEKTFLNALFFGSFKDPFFPDQSSSHAKVYATDNFILDFFSNLPRLTWSILKIFGQRDIRIYKSVRLWIFLVCLRRMSFFKFLSVALNVGFQIISGRLVLGFAEIVYYWAADVSYVRLSLLGRVHVVSQRAIVLWITQLVSDAVVVTFWATG